MNPILKFILDNLLSRLNGSKTYLAGFGLVGLALYQISQGDAQAAIQSFSTGLAALGLRHAINKTAPQDRPAT